MCFSISYGQNRLSFIHDKGFPYFPDIFAIVGNKWALVIWVGHGFENESMEVFFCILLIKNIMEDKRT